MPVHFVETFPEIPIPICKLMGISIVAISAFTALGQYARRSVPGNPRQCNIPAGNVSGSFAERFTTVTTAYALRKYRKLPEDHFYPAGSYDL